MYVVAVCGTKGGVGKTTIAASLAACAAAHGHRSALVDLDPQESLAFWRRMRGRPDEPVVYTGDSSPKNVIDKLELSSDVDWVFLDSPPAFLDTIREMIEVADYVVVPMRTSILDMAGNESVIGLVRQIGRPYLAVLNGLHKGDGTDISAQEFLKDAEVPLAHARIHHSVAHIRAMSSGTVASEVDGGRHKQAGAEIEALWHEVKAATERASKARAKERARV